MTKRYLNIEGSVMGNSWPSREQGIRQICGDIREARDRLSGEHYEKRDYYDRSDQGAREWAHKEVNALTEPQIEFFQRRTDELVNRVKEDKIRTLIFLDKSARPLAHLFIRRWRQLYKEEKRPDIKFLNIGKGNRRGDSNNVISKARNRNLEAESAPLLYRLLDDVKEPYLIVDECMAEGKSLRDAVHLVGGEQQETDTNIFFYSSDNVSRGSLGSYWFPWISRPHCKLPVYDRVALHGNTRSVAQEEKEGEFLIDSYNAALRRIKEAEERSTGDEKVNIRAYREKFERENRQRAVFYGAFVDAFTKKIFPDIN